MLFEADVLGESCPRCGGPGVVLLSLAPAVALPSPRRVPTCMPCATFATTLVKVESTGAWRWLSTDATPPRSDGDAFTGLLPLSATLSPRPAWEAVDWVIADGISQLGGHPSWVNDPIYPPCPSCSASMVFVAQVSMDDFAGPADGVFYVHACERCAIVGVSYDQT